MGTSVEFDLGYDLGEKFAEVTSVERRGEDAERLALAYKKAMSLPVGDKKFAVIQGLWHGFDYPVPLSIVLEKAERK